MLVLRKATIIIIIIIILLTLVVMSVHHLTLKCGFLVHHVTSCSRHYRV